MNTVKFSVFADLHHYPGVFMGGTAEDMRFIQKRALRSQLPIPSLRDPSWRMLLCVIIATER